MSRYLPEIPKRHIDLPGAPLPVGDNKGNHLIVGRGISLKGDITVCNALLVEGNVAGTLENARQFKIAGSGSFEGTATADEAQIFGLFRGTLVANHILVVKPTGRIEGTVHYRTIEIELGGIIDGCVHVFTPAPEEDDDAANPDSAQSE